MTFVDIVACAHVTGTKIPRFSSIDRSQSHARKRHCRQNCQCAAAATAATLSDPDGVARTPEAIEAVWDWAEALARQNTTPTTKKDFDE